MHFPTLMNRDCFQQQLNQKKTRKKKTLVWKAQARTEGVADETDAVPPTPPRRLAGHTHTDGGHPAPPLARCGAAG